MFNKKAYSRWLEQYIDPEYLKEWTTWDHARLWYFGLPVASAIMLIVYTKLYIERVTSRP